jgi:transposase
MGFPLEFCSLGNEASIAAANEGAQTSRCRLPFFNPKRKRKAPVYFSPYLYRARLYRARSLAEHFSNRIRQCRRVATRHDKLAANHLAFIKLAAVRIWLRA